MIFNFDSVKMSDGFKRLQLSGRSKEPHLSSSSSFLGGGSRFGLLGCGSFRQLDGLGLLGLGLKHKK